MTSWPPTLTVAPGGSVETDIVWVPPPWINVAQLERNKTEINTAIGRKQNLLLIALIQPPLCYLVSNKQNGNLA
jgi:hypothetical protein